MWCTEGNCERGILLILLLLVYFKSSASQTDVLEFQQLGTTTGVNRMLLPAEDDGHSTLISIPGGFPFWSSTENIVYVGTNGYFSFGQGLTIAQPLLYPNGPAFTVAPFWADNDIREEGEISYEVHSSGSPLISEVNSFIRSRQGVEFAGTWMVIAEWFQVHEYPYSVLFPEDPTNTYQGILITDGRNSYAVFIYQCGTMGWSGSAAIGYYASGDFYENHNLSSTSAANSVACLNSPTTVWSNVVYQLHKAPEVSIITDPVGPVYPAASLIFFSCHVDSRLSVTYAWESYCMNQGVNQLIFRLTGYDNPGVFTLRIRSTVTEETGCIAESVVCIVTDGIGSVGQATHQITNITGVGLFGATEPISNNSAFIADSANEIGTIYCHSASRESGIGRWIAPSGNNISSALTDAFEVGHFGETLPSYTTLQLMQGSSLSTVHQGIYSCVIPDETGTEQILHIGLYPNGHTGSLRILAVERTSENPLTVSCTTTGLPPTTVQWSKGAQLLSHGDTYQMSQIVTARNTSTYSSLLSIDAPPDVAEGLYRCHVTNEQTSVTQSMNGPSTTVASHHFSVYTVGDAGAIRCSFTGATRTEWLYNGEVVTSLAGDELLLNIAVNDSIHGGVYSCRGYSNVSVIPDLNVAMIIQVPNSALDVSILPSTVNNNRISFVCIGSETVSGLANRASLEWLDPSGDPVPASDGDAIVIIGPFVQATLTTLTLSISLDAVGTSQAGAYTCQGTLVSPALSSPLVKSVQANFTVEIPVPSVSITMSSDNPLYAGSSLTITCITELSASIDTDVIVSALWKKAGDSISSGDRITISQPQLVSSSVYESELTISPLSTTLDSGDYSCEISVHPSPVSPYIAASASASATVSLVVEVPSLLVDVSPLDSSSLNVEPYNTFSILCTTTTPSSVTALEWERQIEGTATPLVDNGDTVVISNSESGPMTTSNLTITETAAGVYIFKCTANLQIPGDTEVEAVATATANVKGPMFPVRPINLRATVANFSSAILEWEVPYVAYTPEQYFAKYGTSNSSLDQMSEMILGGADISAVDQHYSLQLNGLQHDTAYYYQVVVSNTVGTTTSDINVFTIEEIPVFVAITPQGLAEAGEMYSLTCIVSEEQDIIGTPTVAWLGPDGQPLLSGNDISISSEVSGLTITSVIRFYPVEVHHSGAYTCQAEVSEINFNTSMEHDLIVYVHTLTVSIESTNTAYLAATPVTLICVVEDGATEPFTYQWTSTCSGDCFVINEMSATLSQWALRSIDSGEHTCLVTDSAGNTGSSTIQFTVTGIGLHYSLSGPVANNSIVRANSDGSTGVFQCISGSTQPNVGQWIAPDGQELSLSADSPFTVTIGDSTNPGYLSTVVTNGHSLSNVDQGVYSCVLPDESGNEQIIHVGIYLSGFNTPVSISSLELTGDFQPIFTIKCTSTGSPATTVTWTKDDTPLANSETVHMSQILTDATAGAYDNLLSIDASPTAVTGLYSCAVENSLGAATQTVSFAGLQIEGSSVVIVGEVASLTCSSDLDVSSIAWLYSGQVVASSTSQQELELEFDPVSDTIHGREYTCRVTSPYGSQEETIIIVAEVSPDDFSVSVAASDETPVAGQQFTLTCTAAIVQGLQNTPAIEWRDASGIALTSGEDFNVADVMVIVSNNVSLALHFNPLRLTHGQTFSCQARITTSAPPFQLTKTAEWDLFVDRPPFEADIQPPSLISFDIEPYNTFTLSCTATVHDSVVVPKSFQWKRGPEGAEEILSDNGDTLTIMHSNTNAVTSSSVLTVTENTAGSYRFVCTATLQFSEAQDTIFVSNSASVLVKGPENPMIPSAVTTTIVTFNSVTIQWRVSTITYTPEIYIIHYGLSESTLNQRSVTVMGNQDTSVANELFSVTVPELEMDTTYYYRVISTNAHDSASTDTGMFTTLEKDEGLCTRFFQLLLSDVNACNAWRFDRPEEKIAEVTAALSSTVGEQCLCSFPQDYISDAEFACITDDETAVLFRAQLTGNDCERLLSHIEMWVESGSASFAVMNNRLSVDANCILEIESLQATLSCSETDPSSESSSEGQSNVLIIGAAAGGVIGVIIIGIIVVAAVILCTRTLKRQRFNHAQSMDILPNEAYSSIPGIHTGVNNPFYAYGVNSDAYAYPMASLGPAASLPPLVKTGSGDYVKMNPGAEYCEVKDSDSSSGIYEQIHPRPSDEEEPAVENPLYGSVD